ncbi:MAG: radical SAM protein [Candidatus Diapherotrites archaeon]|nr:radical SAM protein [Candidatus Diapherotrites archaeon]
MKDSRKKVLLLLPQPHPENINPGLPLALLTAASMIDRKLFDVRIYSATPKYNYVKRIMHDLDNALCLAVGCLTGCQIRYAIDVIKKVKEINPGLPIIWGGWHASILPEQTLESEYADIVVIGQGERTTAELVERLASGKSLRGLQGIFFKDENGAIVKNEPRPFEDLNNFPPMPFDLVDVEDFVTERDGLRCIGYVSSQGCPYNCAFCADPLVYKRRWSGVNAKRVVDDFQFLAEKHNIGLFVLADQNFFIDTRRVKEMCDEMIRRKLNVKWGRVNGRSRELSKMDEAIWRAVKESGCTDIFVGAESGLQEGLDLVNKMSSTEETVKVIQLARKYGIEVAPCFIVGLPFNAYDNAKTEKQRMEIVERELNAIFDLLDKCYPIKDYLEIPIRIYTPYPGNPLFERSKQLGFKPPQRLEEWADFDMFGRNIPWLSKKIHGVAIQLQDFVFPYASDKYMLRHSRRFKPVHWIFHKTALFRWKHKFFSFPVEHRMLVLFRRARGKLSGRIS